MAERRRHPRRSSTTSFNYEHPPLSKLAYALAIRDLPPDALLPRNRLDPAERTRTAPRHAAAAVRCGPAPGSAASARCRCSHSPCSIRSAALLLAISTWQIKYTSQIMLEPLPGLLSTVMVSPTSHGSGSTPRRESAAALAAGGAARALCRGVRPDGGKQVHVRCGRRCDPGRLVLARPDPTGQPGGRQRLRVSAPVAAARARSGLGLAVDRLRRRQPAHVGRSARAAQGRRCSITGPTRRARRCSPPTFPLWQPFVWLFQAVPWHPGVFYVSLDFFITLLAALGFRSLWQRQRVMALWLVIGLGFLLSGRPSGRSIC